MLYCQTKCIKEDNVRTQTEVYSMAVKKAFLSVEDIERLGLRTKSANHADRSKGLTILPFVRVGGLIKYRRDHVKQAIQGLRDITPRPYAEVMKEARLEDELKREQKRKTNKKK